MKRAKTRQGARLLRHRRIRRKVQGTAACPRMAIMISNRHINVQLIDDVAERTLAAASTVGGEIRPTRESADAIGRRIGEAGRSAGIDRVVVDRGGRAFHGCVKSIVDAAVESGLRIRIKPESADDIAATVEEIKEAS